MSIDQPRTPAGAPAGGQFAGIDRPESTVTLEDVVLTDDDTEYLEAQRLADQDEMAAAFDAVSAMVDRGTLSPAARDMDPAAVLEQHAEAGALNLREKADLFATAGLPLHLPASEVMTGDRIAFAPDGRGFEIVAVAHHGSVVRLEYDDPSDVQMLKEWSAQENSTIPVFIDDNEDRCTRCGEDSTGGEGFDGLCGDCADVAENDGEWDDHECEGHESLDGAHMGETVYCDGSCRTPAAR